jgi:ABC-type glycerol-3-phosphate transport system substrate-binding protein
MHIYRTALIVTLLCMLLALAGCSGSQSAPATPQATAKVAFPSASAAAPSGPDIVPSPTDSIIEGNKVNINVEKDYIGSITVTFQGGNGLAQVNKIDVTLNRADGQVKTANVGINVGDTATLEGTKDTDRIIVYVTMKDGKRYKLVDSLVAYRTR